MIQAHDCSREKMPRLSSLVVERLSRKQKIVGSIPAWAFLNTAIERNDNFKSSKVVPEV